MGGGWQSIESNDGVNLKHSWQVAWAAGRHRHRAAMQWAEQGMGSGVWGNDISLNQKVTKAAAANLQKYGIGFVDHKIMGLLGIHALQGRQG